MLPGIETGLNKVGFLFGAGTSKGAGYPLMGDLTKDVVAKLSVTDRETLESILALKNLQYDENEGSPNIEILGDLVIEASVNSPKAEYNQLSSEIQRLITEIILSVENPNLENHVNFLDALKKRSSGRSTKVTIFTTNYDILFELAAGEVGVRMETGFDGSLKRTFSPDAFGLSRGRLSAGRFSVKNELHINLVKLHGSIAWIKQNGNLHETGIDLANPERNRAIIFPRRRKVMDTLAHPFDQLFTKASRILGDECRYLVSCGFSYGDKHINDDLLIPKLQEGKIRLTALCGTEPDTLDKLTSYTSFQIGLPDRCESNLYQKTKGTEFWKFNALAKLIAP
ncbi:hypothetical protein CSA56_05130 [candidate division KSB3 bacterium]|uniref:Uncharacterized protein n=1 Tax=candidate division KSB3 bacterium TaxID=2044937 RepID=A0A2G6KK53_9BACT|nr:MAG: hypothetical protein CSA56_05130 [candidate division KSB3 bacterium]